MWKRLQNLWALSAFNVQYLTSSDAKPVLRRDPEIQTKRPAIVIEDDPKDIFE